MRRLVGWIACFILCLLPPTGPALAQTSASGATAFADVPATFWAAGQIDALASQGVVSGYPGGLFRPEADVTRAQFVVMLLKAHPVQGSTLTAPAFPDVAPTAWYHQAVEEAAALGWVSGYGGEFHPDAPVTREQAAVILAQVLKLQGMAKLADAMPLDFQDASGIASWAVGAVAICQDLGLMRGFSDGTFRPQEPVTRAQAAVILYALERLIPAQIRNGVGQNLSLAYSFTGSADYTYAVAWGTPVSSRVVLREEGQNSPDGTFMLGVQGDKYWQVNGQPALQGTAAAQLGVNPHGAIISGLGTAGGVALAGLLGASGVPWAPEWDLVLPLPQAPVMPGSQWTVPSGYASGVTTTYTYLGLEVWHSKPTAVVKLTAQIKGGASSPAGTLSGVAGVSPLDGHLRFVRVEGSQGQVSFRAQGSETQPG